MIISDFIIVFVILDLIPLIIFMVMTTTYGRWRIGLSCLIDVGMTLVIMALFRDNFRTSYTLFICIITYVRYQLMSTYRHTVDNEERITRR